MALIDTSKLPCTKPFETTQEIVFALRLALADELAATNLYESIMGKVLSSSVFSQSEEDRDALIEALAEIRDDEIHHQAKLLSLALKLDDNYSAVFSEGVEGE
jgi:hypothetical protein